VTAALPIVTQASELLVHWNPGLQLVAMKPAVASDFLPAHNHDHEVPAGAIKYIKKEHWL
jgi:hypothetical protein